MTTAAHDNPVAAWERLVAAAVLGAERSAAAPAVPGPLADVLPPEADPQQQLLNAAAALSIYLEAGSRPREARRTQIVSDKDHRRPLRDAAHRRLSVVLDDRVELLPQWLGAAADGGWRATPEHLPALLDWAAAHRDSASLPALREVIGARGRWLAMRRPEWRALVTSHADDADNLWETGSRNERLAVLSRMRVEDPPVARKLLESTWGTDSTDDRAAFLEACRVGLCPDDEAFLESALDDRRKPVRMLAAELLSRLPGSALSARMVERACRLIVFGAGKSGVLRKSRPTVTVTLPGDLDKAAKRDGLEATPRNGLGDKAAVLMQMVAATPLSVWSQRSGLSVEDMVAAAAANEWKDALLLGWGRAAVRQADAAWAKTLLQRLGSVKAIADHVARLLSILPPTQREEVVQPWLAAKHDDLTMSLIRACDHPWSEAFSRAVLARLTKTIPRDNAYSVQAYGMILRSDISIRLSPSCADEAGRGWPTAKDRRTREAIERVVAQLLDTLTFRAHMLEELKP